MKNDSRTAEERLSIVPHKHGRTDTEKAGATGARVRAIRKAKGWNLAQLSEVSGVPQSTLSKFETGALSLPLDRVFHVSDALDVNVMELFEPQAIGGDGHAFGRRSVTRVKEGRCQDSAIYNCRWLFPDLLQKQMFPVIQEVKARNLAEFGPLLQHSGEEFALVLEGKVEVITDIYEHVVLGVHEGIYIDSRMGHAFLKVGDDDARILNVSTGVVELPSD